MTCKEAWIFLILLCIKDCAVQGQRDFCQNGTKIGSYPDTVKATSGILQALRDEMQKNGVDCYIIPQTDEHRMEYIAPWFERMSFVSGFTGSAGTAIVTMKQAALWTDGRYFEQIETQVDCSWTIMKRGMSAEINDWIRKELAGKTLAIDRRLVSIRKMEDYTKDVGAFITWKKLDKNLVDEIWTKRPSTNKDKLFINPLKYSGKRYERKLDDLRKEIKKEKANSILVQALDDVAWLLNLRGKDIPYNPFFYSYVLVTLTDLIWYVDNDKLTDPVRQHVCPNNDIDEYCVQIKNYDHVLLADDLRKVAKKGIVWITPKTSVFVADNIPPRHQLIKLSPVAIAKSKKNIIEIKGMMSANIKDSIAIMQYFIWLKKELAKGNRGITEISGAEKLRQFKSKQKLYYDLSFEAISAYGTNGAVIHYSASNKTALVIKPESFYLIDNGAHYLDGSTDITRTIHLGTPTPRQKEMYTYVLKGVIGLITLIFPSKTYGVNIDAFARQALWQNGLDYAHGTGHGIGSFLSIHEGPGMISGYLPNRDYDYPFEEGMVFSDEPGYYEPHGYGIRLESAMRCVEKQLKYTTPNKKFYGFEIITWLPFDRKSIDVNLLTPAEMTWLNNYNKDIRRMLSNPIKKQGLTEVLEFMLKETEPYNNRALKLQFTTPLVFVVLFTIFA